MAKKIKKPSGLTITRNKTTFTFAWKLPGTNYYDDLDVEYCLNGQKDKKGKYVWHPLDPNAKKKKLEHDWKNKTKLAKTLAGAKTSVMFRVRGGIKKKKDGKNILKHSDWAVSTPYTVSVPSDPVVTASWNSELENRTTFSWSVANADAANKKWFNHWSYKTFYYYHDGKKTHGGVAQNWTNGAAYVASGSKLWTEELSVYREARIVGVQAIGPRGGSKVKYACHVYSTPNVAKNIKIESCAINPSGLPGISAKITWNENLGGKINSALGSWTWHPIDQVEVEWVISNPAGGETAPANTSGSVVTTVAPRGGKNGVNIRIDQVPAENQCLFFRVRTVHDKKYVNSSWIMADQLNYRLSPPAFSGLTPSQDYKSFEIFADNSAASDVPDSYLLVSYKSTTGTRQTNISNIGMIPHGGSSTIVQAPENVTSVDEFGFGVQALRGYRPVDYLNVTTRVNASNFNTWAGTGKLYYYIDRRKNLRAKATINTYNSKRSYFIQHQYTNVTSVVRGSNTTEANENFSLLANELYYFTGPGFIPVAAGSQYNPNLIYYSAYPVKIIRTVSNGETFVYKQYTRLPSPIKKPNNTENLMVSTAIWQGGEVPKPPANVKAVMDDEVALVSWDWSWSKASSIELSWADHRDAWESTDEPSSYMIDRIKATQWRIAGLSKGTTWHIRARFIQNLAEADVEGPWSPIVSLNLTSAPATPTLNLSKTTVTLTEEFIASWVYTSTDGTYQESADIFEAQEEGMENPDEQTAGAEKVVDVWYGSYRLASSYINAAYDANKQYYTYDATTGDYTEVTTSSEEDFSIYYVFDSDSPLISTPVNSTVQSLALNALALGWVPGKTYGLALRLKSRSGVESAMSPVVHVTVAEPLPKPTIPTIDGLQLETETVTTLEEETGQETTEVVNTYLALKKLPITLTIAGAGDLGTTIAIIERAESYLLERPDEVDDRGYEGEVVYQHRQTGEAPIVINKDDLIGRLDDGAKYRLIVEIIDVNGQHAKNEDTEFKVSWDHQPTVPNANIEVIQDRLAVKIDPVIPAGLMEGDRIDIYRLSVDMPEPIIEDGDFLKKTFDVSIQEGKTYYTLSEGVFVVVDSPSVEDIANYYEKEIYYDPYPAIGEYGGHRIVYKSKYDDYYNDRTPAWNDYTEEDGDIVKTPSNVINFGGDEVEFMYNIDLSSSWKKDFKQTEYLGGAVVGDWNPAVVRTGSVATVVAREYDQDVVRAMRRLADYAGICHVRTKDGSSYPADVQVSETQSHGSYPVISYSLNITRVDAQSPDGMTEAEWDRYIEEEGE